MEICFPPQRDAGRLLYREAHIADCFQTASSSAMRAVRQCERWSRRSFVRASMARPQEQKTDQEIQLWYLFWRLKFAVFVLKAR